MSLQVGDVVTLKSGGPAMTVRLVGNDGKVHCGWFNQQGNQWEYKHQDFPPDALKKQENQSWS